MSLRRACFAFCLLVVHHVSDAQVNALPILQAVDGTEATDKAVRFLIDTGRDEKTPPLRFESRPLSPREFCEGLNKGLPGVYIGPLGLYRSCEREMRALAAFDFPFVASDWEKARELLSGPMGLAVAEALAKKGVHVLTFWDGDTRVLSSTRPILAANDMRGRKVVGPSTFASAATARQSGAQPVQMAFAEVYAALQTGAADTADTSLTAFDARRLREVHQHVTVTNHSFDPFVVAIPAKTIGALTAGQRAFLEIAARRSTVYQIREAKQASARALQRIREQGVSVVPYSPELARGFMTLASLETSRTQARQVFAESSAAVAEGGVRAAASDPFARYWKVFFVTNRARKDNAFTSDLGANLLYGEVDVQLELDAPVDSVTEYDQGPLRGLVNFFFGKKDVDVRWNTVSSQPFAADLTAAPHALPAKAPIIYVHGFANSFDDAVKRAAWLGWNTKRPAIAFAWASQGSGTPGAYRDDQATAAKTWSSLAAVLAQLTRGPQAATDIDIVAHSMGAHVLLGALEELEKDPQAAAKIKFRQVIFVAADVPSARMEKTWKSLARFFEREPTLYISDHDKALGISRQHMNPKEGDRAGLAPPVLVSSGMESIFIGTNEFSFIGHSYHVLNGVIVDDIVEALRYGIAANDRRGCGPAPAPNKYYIIRRLKDL
jgi:TRAP-type C4-dicarboxylate transport system substrate-binding protein/esterase/lipase superfamily enzyme